MSKAVPTGRTLRLPSLYDVDPEDARKLRGKSESYIRGWNQVKRKVTFTQVKDHGTNKRSK